MQVVDCWPHSSSLTVSVFCNFLLIKAVFAYITFAILAFANDPSVTPGFIPFLFPESVFYKRLLTKFMFRDFTSDNTWVQDTQGIAVILEWIPGK